MRRPDASTDGPTFCVHGIWVSMAVCRLLAFNVGSLAASVSLTFSVLARNVSRKYPLFAGPGKAGQHLLYAGGEFRRLARARPVP
jgi:hypothetical protein